MLKHQYSTVFRQCSTSRRCLLRQMGRNLHCFSQTPGSAWQSHNLSVLSRPQRTQHSMIAAVKTPSLTSQLTSLVELRELDELRTDTQPNFNDMELRDVREISYVSKRRLDDQDFDPDAVDKEGLPLVYNEEAIAAFWKERPGEMAGRWAKFAGISAPWLTKLANAFVRGQMQDPKTQAALARDAVDNFQALGPTYVKIGQVMSVRPDVLPPAIMQELASLQDRIEPFPTVEARALIEEELGAPIDQVFSEFGEAPVGSASLAQVYRAVVRETGQVVAVKVQRPDALSTISKDLYVMRRAVSVYERIVRRFTAQTTDYQQLLSTFAEGLYTELDFRNEALNALRMTELLQESKTNGMMRCEVIIPEPVMELTTRRCLVMEWIPGVKLTTLPPDEIRTLTKEAQEAFLTQLLDVGYIHGDPHGGNLLKVTEGPHAGKLALLDFGLVAEIPSRDREAMVSATIHLANRDWDALIDDFIALGFLPLDVDRGRVIPVMDRVLGPYLRGGGAKAFNFQALSTDLLSATLEIPFGVPPYMSLLARSVATLEGIALLGDPDYQMVSQAYPFVVRKVLRNDTNGSARLLQDLMLDPSGGRVRVTRLSALLNAALGYVADETDGFIDFDAIPAEGASVEELLQFLLAPQARELRPLLVREVANAVDLLMRDRVRRAYASIASFQPRLPVIGALPVPLGGPSRIPVWVPGRGFVTAEEVVAEIAPPLNQTEEVYLQSFTELMAGVAGLELRDVEALDLPKLLQQALNPSEQITELQNALTSMARSPESSEAARQVASQVIEDLMQRLSQRTGVAPDTLFPIRATLLSALQ